MGYQKQNFEDEWAGLEPEQPEGQKWMLWLGIGVVALFLIGICLLGSYFLWQQFQDRTAVPPQPTLIRPTSLAETAVPATHTPEADIEATVTIAPIAPTATLFTPPTPTSPPVGAGNVDAAQLPAPPTIDGNLSEWGSAAAVESNFLVFSRSDWDGSDDLTAVWRIAWDADNLYIGVAVTDDIHAQNQSGNQIFRGDSVDMQFDTDRNGDYGDGLSPDDFQITFSPGDFAGLPPAAFRFQGTSNGRIEDAPGGHNITIAALKTSEGYNIEAAIPWSDLNLTPAAGLVTGLSLNVSDNDTPGAAVQEIMKSHVSARTLTDPTSWGTLTLR